MKKLALSLILILLSLFLFGGEWNQYYFRFELIDKSPLTELSRMISIDNIRGNWVYAYANDWEWEAFASLGYRVQHLPPPSQEFPVVMSSDVRSWDAYPTYGAYLDMMNGFATNYPSLCQVVSIGSTVNGRSLLMAKITSNVSVDSKKPQFLYTSTMHGDELTGYMLMLRLADTLLSQYGSNPRITNILDNIELWICPNTNPDGTYYGGNNTVASARRANYNGIDLNRNYPNPDGSLNTGSIQPETQAMMNFANARHFVMGANFHGGEEVVNYPWDFMSALHPDNNWFISSSLVYASSAQAHGPSGYFTGLSSNGIINGADWYMISGGRQDWMNYTANGREVTIECSRTKMPAASTMPSYWNYNYDALLSYMEQALYGIHGEVKDVYGNPLAATITVLNHDNQYSIVHTNPVHGDFYRYLPPGSYSLKIETAGYNPKIVPVNVYANQKTPLTVEFGELPHTQNIELTAGWNLVSLNVTPSSDSVTDLLSGISGVKQLKTMTNSYIPSVNNVFNTLQTLSPQTAYFVNMQSPATLVIPGEPLNPALNPIDLQTGWNFVPYLSQDAASPLVALSSISLMLQEVRDLDSHWTGSSADTLHQMQPGKGYWVKVSQPCQLVYP